MFMIFLLNDATLCSLKDLIILVVSDLGKGFNMGSNS